MKKINDSIFTVILFLIAGALFIISGAIGKDKNFTFISLGCSFVAIGLAFYLQYNKKQKNK
jgi:uncharacterized membrane protein